MTCSCKSTYCDSKRCETTRSSVAVTNVTVIGYHTAAKDSEVTLPTLTTQHITQYNINILVCLFAPPPTPTHHYPHPTPHTPHTHQARSQPARWGGSELGWVEHQAHPPPLGHCPCDVINLKNAPTLGHSQAPPPLDIARVTSSTYSKGGTTLLKGGTKLLKGGTKLLKGGTKSLGWPTGGGVVRPPPTPPWLRACTHTHTLSTPMSQ